jgi:hypothetical protein
MDALVAPLERVVEAADWFVRTPSLRLLHVTTSAFLRNPVLAHLAAAEVLPHAGGPCFVLETPATSDAGTWDARVEELRLDWDELRASAPAGATVEALPEDEVGAEPLTRFASVLAACLSRLPEPAHELVVVLAPMWIGDDERPSADAERQWRADLSLLLDAPSLARARFVVVEVDTRHTRPVVEALGDRAESLDASPDPAAVADESRARLANIEATPPGATGVALAGGAGPAVAPPKRAGQPEPPPASATFDLALMKRLQVAILSAVTSMRDGDAEGAARHQRAAVDLCVAHGLTQQAVVNELVLGGYALAGGGAATAREVFASARDRALAAQLAAQAAQAEMAIAACWAIEGRHHDAALAYSDAGHMAERAGVAAFAIEAFRACGQLMLSVGHEEAAARAFRRALDVADATDARGTSAVDAARSLSQLCRARGLREQAASLDAQIALLEERERAPIASA